MNALLLVGPRRLLGAVLVGVLLVVMSGTRVVAEEVDVAKTEKWAEATVEQVRDLAQRGDAYAQTLLGLFYSEGNGVAEDAVEAVKWWRKAAEQGNAIAQNAMGMM